MRGSGLSRFGGLIGAVVWLAAVLLGGCATGKEAEVKRLQARSVYERGLKDLEEGRTALGLSALQEAVALDPDSPLYHNVLGVLYLNLKRNPEALDELKRAVDLDGTYGSALHNLGVAYATTGKWDEAIRAYNKALSLPTYGNLEGTYNNLGWAYYNLDRLQEAEEALRLALKLDPKMVAASYHLGLVLLKAERRDEAKAEFRRARELAPDTPFGLAAHQHLKALGEGG
jgi:Tfp pilus assembly protein PilF